MKRLDRSIADTQGVVSEPYPVKVLQFGEGNFLRAFIDWMIAQLNGKGLFGGRVTVVQPLAQGMIDVMAEQDSLYTLLLRGVQDGEVVVDRQIIDVIERGLNVYTQFDDYLKEAENPELRIIVSNTTEAGIVLRSADQPADAPPVSFPGKLLRLLRHRYDVFGGAQDKGFLLFPCELIEKNGDTLREVLMQLSKQWYPEDATFHEWLYSANVFFNTLVDRIVSGYPRAEADTLCETFGYEDQLIDTGEIFHFLAVEGPAEFKREFPLVQAGLNVKWCDDLTPYRTRKVRILNGAHTMTVLAAHLCGLETVEDCTKDPLFSRYLKHGIFEEIMPTLELPADELRSYGRAVLERFSNPYIRHLLLSISLNSVSKFKTRVLPSLLEYRQRKGEWPTLLTASFAALVLFYRGDSRAGDGMQATRALDGATYTINDDADVLDWFLSQWQQEDGQSLESCERLMTKVLQQSAFWGQDLADRQGLARQTAAALDAMLHDGVKSALSNMMEV